MRCRRLGASYWLWLRKQEALGRSDGDITVMTLRRGVFLFALGLAFNFCIWLPDETFNWDILTLLGTGFLVLAFARHLPPASLVVACVVVALVSPVLRLPALGDYAAYWKAGDYEYDFTFRDIAYGFLANGYFPVFPWILYPVVGYLAGDLLFRPGRARLVWAAWIGVVLLGLAGTALADLPAPLAAFPRFTPLLTRLHDTAVAEFPPSLGYLLGTLGLLFVALAVLRRQADTRDVAKADGPVLRFLRRYSTFSLSVYVVHHMVILWPLWLVGVWTEHSNPTFFYRRAMAAPAAFGLAVAFIVACTFLLIVLEPYRRFSLESLMRRVCDIRPSGTPGVSTNPSAAPPCDAGSLVAATRSEKHP